MTRASADDPAEFELPSLRRCGVRNLDYCELEAFTEGVDVDFV